MKRLIVLMLVVALIGCIGPQGQPTPAADTSVAGSEEQAFQELEQQLDNLSEFNETELEELLRQST